MQTSGWARGSHRQAGARLSHNHRICKDFNNEPLGLMIENRSGVNSCMHMLMRCRDAPYKWTALLEAWKHSWIYSDRFTSSALGEKTHSNHDEDVFCGLARSELSWFDSSSGSGAGEKDAQASCAVCGSTQTSNILRQGLSATKTKGYKSWAETRILKRDHNSGCSKKLLISKL